VESGVAGFAAQPRALVAKVNGDDALLPEAACRLEVAVPELIPAKREIVGAASKGEVRSLAAAVTPSTHGSEALPNSSGIARAARQESGRRRPHDGAGAAGEQLFERGLARFTALRNVFTQQTNDLFDHIGLERFARTPSARAVTSRTALSRAACAAR
jgi:hypothetical protein